MEDIKTLAQPYLGAITLLECIAEHGCDPYWADGIPTPNRELCLRFAKELREVAELQKDATPIGYLFQHEDTGLTQCVDVQQVEWGFEKNNPRWINCGPLFTHPKAATVPQGWKLVPVVPTLGMLQAGELESDNEEGSYETVFRAMLEAAPSLPDQETLGEPFQSILHKHRQELYEGESLPAAEDVPRDKFFRKPDGSIVMVPRDVERLAAEDARDAARYRWLRSQHEGHEKHRNAEWFEYTEPTPCAFTVFMPGTDESLVPVGCIPGELDEAIDAAMSQDSKGEV